MKLVAKLNRKNIIPAKIIIIFEFRQSFTHLNIIKLMLTKTKAGFDNKLSIKQRDPTIGLL
jgi:hypothetical protein